MSAPRVWAGVDVGGRRKGFHAAVVDARRVVRAVEPLATPARAAAWLGSWMPRLVAIDSPCALARPGQTMRDCERRFLAVRICGIRGTPNPDTLARHRGRPAATYYEWIEHGLELYQALRDARIATIECFPTASWTRWGGPRGHRRRAEWSRRILDALRLQGVPGDLGQDGRDAVAAALTAWAHHHRQTDSYGAIVVPRGPAGEAEP